LTPEATNTVVGSGAAEFTCSRCLMRLADTLVDVKPDMTTREIAARLDISRDDLEARHLEVHRRDGDSRAHEERASEHTPGRLPRRQDAGRRAPREPGHPRRLA